MTTDILDPDFPGFSLQDPPDSVGIAHIRLAHIELDIEHVRAQLEFKNLDEFETDNDYYEWRGRAMSAYAYKRREVGFLERWMNTQELLASVLDASKTDSPIIGIISVMERVRAQLRVEYQIVYTRSLEPPDLVSAQRRKSYLDILVQKYKGVAQGLIMLLDLCHVDDKECRRLLTKLISSVADIEKENQLLRAFLRKQRSSAVETLMSALRRCLEEGFVLTGEESDSLNEMFGHKAELKEGE